MWNKLQNVNHDAEVYFFEIWDDRMCKNFSQAVIFERKTHKSHLYSDESDWKSKRLTRKCRWFNEYVDNNNTIVFPNNLKIYSLEDIRRNIFLKEHFMKEHRKRLYRYWGTYTGWTVFANTCQEINNRKSILKFSMSDFNWGTFQSRYWWRATPSV